MLAMRGLLCLGFLLSLKALTKLFLNETSVGEDFWSELGVWPLPLPLRAVLILAAVSAVALVWMGPAEALGPETSERAMHLVYFFASAAGALALVYRVFPGYVYTGYLCRHCAFAVFAANPLLAFGCYLLFAVGIHLAECSHAPSGWPRRALRVVLATNLALGTVMSFLWIWVQVNSAIIFPPNGCDVLPVLEREPFQGSSFITNVYSVPITISTRAWAYFCPIPATLDALQGGDKVGRGDGGPYLWLADKDDPKYTAPSYLLLIADRSLPTLLKARQMRGERHNVSSLPIVEWVETRGATLGHQVVARDPGADDSWVIIKLNWEE
jgi:hypothetical protein